MTHWDTVYETAIDNYGLITTAQAIALGIKPTELPRWVKTGRLVRRGHGVYRLTKYTPSDYDYYAEALAFTGDNSSIFGESVLAMQNLALVNPPKIYVAVGNRLRKRLPKWVQAIPRTNVERPAFYHGIRCQPLPDAILHCKTRVPRERLNSAIAEARKQGLITSKEERTLRREITK